MTQDIAPARLLTDTWTLSSRNAISQLNGKEFDQIENADVISGNFNEITSLSVELNPGRVLELSIPFKNSCESISTSMHIFMA